MALSQSVLSELLDAFRAGEGVDLVRDAVRLVMQELIETEATEQIGADRYERTDTRVTERNGPAPGCWRPRPATSSCASPSCARARSSRRSWSRAAASTRRCTRW